MPRMTKEISLTPKRLREVYAYDPATGLFERIEKSRGGKPKEGKDAGCLTTNGYRVISVDGVHYFAHRLAWMYITGEWPSRWIIHVNGNRSDNRIDNLKLRAPSSTKGNKVELTHARLKEVLAYDEATGIFRWKNPTTRTKVGDVAGVVAGLGYRYMSVDGLKYLAHRLAWFYVHAKWPISIMDHINGDRGDNRICNLREASHVTNGHNRKITGKNTTGYKGVFRMKSGKYGSRIMVNYQIIPLGSFLTPEEAFSAYCDASKRYHGEFGRTK